MAARPHLVVLRVVAHVRCQSCVHVGQLVVKRDDLLVLVHLSNGHTTDLAEVSQLARALPFPPPPGSRMMVECTVQETAQQQQGRCVHLHGNVVVFSRWRLGSLGRWSVSPCPPCPP
jgi:hypothetical protein